MGSVASTNRTSIGYAPETTWGQYPGGATFTEFRTTGATLSPKINSVQSNEIRADRQVADIIRTGVSPQGSINWELSYGNCDQFFESALFNSWSTPVNISGTDISVDASDNSFNSTTTSFSGIKAGQLINVVGFTNGVGNNGLFRVKSVSANKVVVDGRDSPMVTEAAGPSVTITSSAMLANGTTRKSFSISQYHSDVDLWIDFMGMVVNQMDMKLSADSIITGSFQFLGKESMHTGGMGPLTTFEPAPTELVMTAGSFVSGLSTTKSTTVESPTDGGLYIKDISFSTNNNLRPIDVIAAEGPVDLGEGSFVVTGTLNAYLQFPRFLDYTVFDTNFSLLCEITAQPGGSSGNRYYIFFPRVKVSSYDLPVSGKDQDILENVGWQAVRHPDYGSTIIIDRF